jgi:hypothetical protein
MSMPGPPAPGAEWPGDAYVSDDDGPVELCVIDL